MEVAREEPQMQLLDVEVGLEIQRHVPRPWRWATATLAVSLCVTAAVLFTWRMQDPDQSQGGSDLQLKLRELAESAKAATRLQGSSLAAFEVSIPQRRVLAVLGRPVVLGCSYAPGLGDSLDGLVVTWQTVKDDQVLHSFYYGQDQLALQNARYRNRTSLFHPLLGAGNASLRLDRVGPWDSGRYLCTIYSQLGIGKAEVQLEYAAFYTEPRLNIQVLPSSISLQYQSEGYPAPQVQWTDSTGCNLTALEELSGPREDGFLSLRTSVMLEDPGPRVNLSFTLRNAVLGQVLERPVSLSLAPGDLGQCTDSARVTIPLSCVLCLLLCLGLAVFAYFRCKRNGRPFPF